MRVYQCNSCGRIIENPYKEKMKEFYVDADFDCGMYFPIEHTRKVKIHLCDNCYKGLRHIAEKEVKQ